MLEFYLTTHIEINSKLIKDLNAMTKTITLVEENIDIILCDLRLGSDFLDMTSKAQATKRTGKLDLINI